MVLSHILNMLVRRFAVALQGSYPKPSPSANYSGESLPYDRANGTSGRGYQKKHPIHPAHWRLASLLPGPWPRRPELVGRCEGYGHGRGQTNQSCHYQDDLVLAET